MDMINNEVQQFVEKYEGLGRMDDLKETLKKHIPEFDSSEDLGPDRPMLPSSMWLLWLEVGVIILACFGSFAIIYRECCITRRYRSPSHEVVPSPDNPSYQSFGTNGPDFSKSMEILSEWKRSIDIERAVNGFKIDSVLSKVEEGENETSTRSGDTVTKPKENLDISNGTRITLSKPRAVNRPPLRPQNNFKRRITFDNFERSASIREIEVAGKAETSPFLNSSRLDSFDWQRSRRDTEEKKSVSTGQRSYAFHSLQKDDCYVSIGSSTELPIQAGRVAENFELGKSLGQGGFGSVVRVRNRLDGMLYALKGCPIADLKGIHSYLREAQSMAKMKSNRVVRYYGAWIEPITPDLRKFFTDPRERLVDDWKANTAAVYFIHPD